MCAARAGGSTYVAQLLRHEAELLISGRLAGGRRVHQRRFEAKAAEALQQLGLVEVLVNSRVVVPSVSILVGRVDGGGLGEGVPRRVT